MSMPEADTEDTGYCHLWQHGMANKRVVELAEINDIRCEIRRGSGNWLGHLLRKEGENNLQNWGGHQMAALRRTVERERNKAGWKR